MRNWPTFFCLLRGEKRRRSIHHFQRLLTASSSGKTFFFTALRSNKSPMIIINEGKKAEGGCWVGRSLLPLSPIMVDMHRKFSRHVLITVLIALCSHLFLYHCPIFLPALGIITVSFYHRNISFSVILAKFHHALICPMLFFPP